MRLPSLTAPNLSTAMNISRLAIVPLTLALAISCVCVEAKSQQQGETKPKGAKKALPDEPPYTDPATVKPNALTLVVVIDLTGELTLNLEPAGTTDDTRPLVERLEQILAERKQNSVYEPGAEAEMKVASTVLIRAPKSTRYAAVVKVIDAVRSAGGDPIGLETDDTKRKRRRAASPPRRRNLSRYLIKPRT